MEYNSIRREAFHNAVRKNLISCNWKPGLKSPNIQVYDIITVDNWNFHLTVTFGKEALDKNGQVKEISTQGVDITKLHFTLRRGLGKGDDAFAWYLVRGHNKNARLIGPDIADKGSLFSHKDVPSQIKQELETYDSNIRAIFAIARSYNM